MKKISFFLFSLTLSLGSFKGSCANRQRTKKIPEQNYARNKFFFHDILKKLRNRDFLDTVARNSFLMEFIEESSNLPEDEKKYLFRKIFPYFLENLTYDVLRKNRRIEEYKKDFFSAFDNFIDTIYQKNNKDKALTLFEKSFRIFYDFLLDENTLSNEDVDKFIENIQEDVNQSVKIFEENEKIFNFIIDFDEESEEKWEDSQDVSVRVKIKSVEDFKKNKIFYYTCKTKNIKEIKEESTDIKEMKEESPEKEISQKEKIKLKEKEEKRRNEIKKNLEEEINTKRSKYYRSKSVLFSDEEQDLSSIKSCNANNFIAKEISFYKIKNLYTAIKDDYDLQDDASSFMDNLNTMASYLAFKGMCISNLFFKKQDLIRELHIENFYNNFKEKIFQKNKDGHVFYLQDLLNDEFLFLQNALVQHYPSEFHKKVFIILPRQHSLEKISLEDFLSSFDCGVEIDTFALDLRIFFSNLLDYIRNNCLASASKPLSTLTMEDIEAMKNLKESSFHSKKEKQKIIFDNLILSSTKFRKGLEDRDLIKTLKIHKNFFPNSKEDGRILRIFFEEEVRTFPFSQEDGKILRDFFSSEEE